MPNRRTFLHTVALTGATATIIPNALWSATRPAKDKLGVALVGLGYYSTDLLAPALQQTKYCTLAGVVTGTPAKAETWRKQYNISDKNIYSYQNFDQIANNPDIDVVYVVLPPSMHEEYVRTVQRQEGTYEPVKFDVTLRSNKHWSVNIITLQDVSQENWYDFRKLFYSLEQAALVWYKRYGFYPVEYDGRTYPPDYVPPKPWDADLTPKERQEREYYQTYHVKRELTD